MKYPQMDAPALKKLLDGLKAEYEMKKVEGLNLDMSRGKPNADQIDFSRPMLDTVNSSSDLLAEDGANCGNYLGLDGIPEAKRLMAEILDVEASEVFVGGNSSLNLMHDLMSFCWLFPLPGSDTPWCKQDEVKFLCPVPGYDRHFSVTQHLGIKMIPVPMTPDGPDMDIVEDLAKNDASVKGMWCVPKYSNPQGVTYSDETVRRMAAMKPAARDFRIFWDNAYAVHDFYVDNPAKLLPLLVELKKHGNDNNVFMFTSTSKITFPGGGISAIGASAENIDYIKKQMGIQTIGYDKINQLRHARYFKDLNDVKAHMKLHASVMQPKFETVFDVFEKNLGGLGIAEWEKPMGGYFICVESIPGCAKRTITLCKEAGLVMTGAGATHPYGDDPDDKTMRVAPSFPGLGELKSAAELFCLCLRLAAAERLQLEAGHAGHGG